MSLGSRRLSLTLGALLVASLVPTAAQQPDPFVGKWAVNLAKSKYDPGPAPKSLNRTIVDRGGDVWLVTTEGVNADGSPAYNQTAFKGDGQDYPIASKGVQNILMIALKRVDRQTTEYNLKVQGKVVNSVKGVVSKDGKTITETITGTNPQGKPINNTVVWERQ